MAETKAVYYAASARYETDGQVDTSETETIWVSKPTLIPLKRRGEKLF